MRINYSIILLTLFLIVTTSNAQSSSVSSLPEVFKKSIPSKLKGNLKLVEVENRRDSKTIWYTYPLFGKVLVHLT